MSARGSERGCAGTLQQLSFERDSGLPTICNCTPTAWLRACFTGEMQGRARRMVIGNVKLKRGGERVAGLCRRFSDARLDDYDPSVLRPYCGGLADPGTSPPTFGIRRVLEFTGVARV